MYAFVLAQGSTTRQLVKVIDRKSERSSRLNLAGERCIDTGLRQAPRRGTNISVIKSNTIQFRLPSPLYVAIVLMQILITFEVACGPAHSLSRSYLRHIVCTITMYCFCPWICK